MGTQQPMTTTVVKTAEDRQHLRPPRRFGTIRTRLLVAFVLLVLLTTAAVSVSSIFISFKSGKRQAIAQLDSISVLKEAEIKTWVQDLQTELVLALAGEETKKSSALLLSKETASRDFQKAHQKLLYWFQRIINLTTWFDELFLMTLAGDVILTTDPTKEVAFRSLQPYFTEGLKGPGIHLQTLSYSSSREGLNTLVIVRPVDNGKGETTGVLCGRVGLSKLNEILSERAKFGKTGETYLVGLNHVLLTPSRFAGYQPGKIYIHTAGVNASLETQVNGFGLYTGYRGVPVVGVYRWLPVLNMALLAEQDQAETFRPIYTTLALNAIVALIAVILAVAASLWYTRGIASPLANLAETATRIADGDLELTAKIEREDEIGALARAFNSMTAQLRRRAEALLASQARYRLLLDTIPDAVVVYDQEGRATYINPAFEQTYGWLQEELLGRSIDFVPAHEAERTRGAIELLLSGETELFETQRLTKDGKLLDVQLKSDTFHESEGSLAGSIIIHRDITDRKRAQEELKEYSERLEEMVKERTQELESAQEELVRSERLAVLGQLTAMVSHELRNPLGVIGTSAFYLKSNLKDSGEKIQKHLGRIDEQVNLCDSIVNDLLELTRKRQADMVEGDLHTWLEAVLDQTTIPEQVSLVWELAPGLPMVSFDRDKLQRVVINLINNAVQAVIERQERFKHEDELYQPQVKVATSLVEDGVCIEVKDNGIGMDDETAGQAFEPLFTTRARGTGLGLAIVQKIVEEHGGSVSLKSEPDQGTKATVKIPLLTRQQEQADGK